MVKVPQCLLGLVVLLVGAALTVPVAALTTGAVEFRDVTTKVGLTHNGKPIIGEQWGDIAVGDFTGSGWDGVYIGHHGVCNLVAGAPCTVAGLEGSLTWPWGAQLFRNNGNGTFTDVTDQFLPRVTDMTQHRHFALWCDIEGTGFEDLILGTGFRSDTTDTTGVNDIWLRNNKGMSFFDIASRLGTTDISSKVSVMTCGNLISKSVSAQPDVLLANLDPTEGLPRRLSQDLWVNTWPRVPFKEQANQRGLTGTTVYTEGVIPYGLACADFRRLGIMDCLATGNNYSVWFLNNGNGTFLWTQDGAGVVATLNPYSHDGYFADFTGRGFLDAAVADVSVNAIRILCNNGRTIVSECASIPLPNGDTAQARAIAVGDFDNSGAPSIFVTMSRGCVKDGNGCKGPDALLMNNGRGRFTDMATRAGLNHFVGTVGLGGGGAAVIDYDMDGRLDLIVGYNEEGAPGPFIIYRNVTQNGNSWVGFRLKGHGTIGSWVTITACGKRQVQQLTARTGWVHQSTRVVHFGLGQCGGPVSAEIIWRTGQMERFSIAANGYYTVTSNPNVQPVPLK